MTELTTRTARKRLKPRASVYAQVLSEGRALAYRRRAAASPGRWMLRTARIDGGYGFEVLGVADDFADADGTEVLTYPQALALALGKRSADPNRISVAEALSGWARSKCQVASSDKQRLDIGSAARRIAAAFPRKTLGTIGAREIGDWMRATVEDGGDPRARRATANRSLATLKAALTKAADESAYQGPRGWQDAKKFAKADSFGSRVIVLSEADEDAWVAAARPDVAKLLTSLRMTGARFGEISAAIVRDLNGVRLTLAGKTGKRTITLSEEKAAWFGRLAMGRAPAEPLVSRRDGSRWPVGGQIKLACPH